MLLGGRRFDLVVALVAPMTVVSCVRMVLSVEDPVQETGTSTHDLGDASLDDARLADGDASAVVVRLNVVPLYPQNGASWLDYVANDDPSQDRFHQDDVTCDPSTPGTYLHKCIHGGEFRKVVARGARSCAGLSLTEELGLFHWRCVEEPGLMVVFYSDGLREAKGIGDALDYSAQKLSFAKNRVTITDGHRYMGQSPIELWWDNTLHDVIAEGLTAANPNVLSGGGLNDIYVVTEDVTTDGFNLNADRIALVVRPGRVHSFSGANNANSNAEPSASGTHRAAVAVGAQRFTWIEGATPALAESTGICVRSSYMTRINNVLVDAAGAGAGQDSWGLTLFGGHGNHVSGIRSSRGFRCAEFLTTYLTVSRFVGAGCRNGIIVWGGSDIWLDRVTVSNTRTYEALSFRSHRTYISGLLLVNLSSEGLAISRNPDPKEAVVTNLTVVNTPRVASCYRARPMGFARSRLLRLGNARVKAKAEPAVIGTKFG